MHTTQATLATTDAARLIKRLCAHWAHKFPVETETCLGKIDFGESRCTLSSDTEQLHIQLDCPNPTTSKRMQQVVIDHLQRMSKTELPPAVWSAPHVE